MSWIGVDLDATLAHYEGWKGSGHIGDPIPRMVERVRAWLKAGKEVKIFTARACVPEEIPLIQDWLENVAGLPRLPVTNVKDFRMLQLWDDRVVQVRPNKGHTLTDGPDLRAQLREVLMAPDITTNDKIDRLIEIFTEQVPEP